MGQETNTQFIEWETEDDREMCVHISEITCFGCDGPFINDTAEGELAFMGAIIDGEYHERAFWMCWRCASEARLDRGDD